MNLATNPIRRGNARSLNWDPFMASVKEDFPRVLAELMQRNGTKKAVLARALKVSNSTVRDWLDGRILPEMSRLDDLASYFQVDRRTFLAPSTERPVAIPQKDLDSILAELARARGYKLVKSDL